MEEQQICPWCDTEILWDEETGPEAECPYCLNELSGYRTLEVGLDDEEEVALEPAAYGTADDYLDAQEASQQCAYCHEFMLHTGTILGSAAGYTPAAPAGYKPLLGRDSRFDVFVCPSCYQTQLVLSGRDRALLAQRLK